MNKILHGDCLELMKNIPGGSIDMILCDLPYGSTQCKWDIQISFMLLWHQYKRVIKPTGAILLFGTEPFSSYLRLSNIEMYKYDWVWDKVKGTGFLNAKKQPMRNHELISVFYKKQCTYNPQKTFGHIRKKSVRRIHKQSEVYGRQSAGSIYDSTERYPRSIQVFSSDIQKINLHPTQKPVLLCEFLIKTYTNEGDIVLDNCAGSGTTGVSCENTNRKYILIEKKREYYDIIIERLKKI